MLDGTAWTGLTQRRIETSDGVVIPYVLILYLISICLKNKRMGSHLREHSGTLLVQSQ
jgi:hypothetical protein